MTSLLYYLLQVIITSGILYLYYHFALRNKKFHQYNRFYLLASAALSILIPFLDIPVYFTEQETQSSFVLQTLTTISDRASIVSIPATQGYGGKDASISTTDILYYGYILLAVIALSGIIFSLLKIRRLSRSNPVEKIGNINFVNTREPSAPFSFFRWLFWHRSIELNSPKGEQIFRHELYHIRQRHSLDIIFMELITVICWVNPFFHIIKKEIRAIHEFLADRYAVADNQQWDYAELLLMQVLQTKESVVNPFFGNQIKRRIAMLTNPQKTSYRYIRKLLVLPVAAVVMTLFAFSYRKYSATTKMAPSNPPIVMSIDKLEAVINKDTLPEPNNKKSISKDYLSKISPGFTTRIANLVSKGPIYEFREAPGLIIVNGEKFTPEEAEEKFNNLFVKSAEFKTIAPGNAKAIAEYGAVAAKGVLIFEKVIAIKQTDIDNKLENYLVIIDGVIAKDANSKNDFGGILPHDIESVSILKDEEAIKRYGSDGKNGVIIIKTKKGRTDSLPVVIDYSHDRQPDQLVHVKPEIEPVFPGGENAWKRYLARNLDLSIPLTNHAPTGVYTVHIRFFVSKNGSIKDIAALTNYGFGMEKEAIRMIEKGPAWVAGIHYGKSVGAYKTIPIVFRVSNPATTKLTETFNNVQELKQRQLDVAAIKAIAKNASEVAYVYKGRTYVFANNEATRFTEQDGTEHAFLLNGNVITSADEVNKRINRSQVEQLSIISGEPLAKYNLSGSVAFIKTQTY